jgi:hypothetical protein
LENLDTEVDINRVWETIRDIKISAKKSLSWIEEVQVMVQPRTLTFIRTQKTSQTAGATGFKQNK